MSRNPAVQPVEAADRGGPAVPLTGMPLVTGGGGFAGPHLLHLLTTRGSAPVAPSSADLDLRDRRAVDDAVRSLAPSAVFHLAAFSSPRLSWEQPDRAIVANLEMTLNLFEAVRLHAPRAAVVLVGSGQIYGQAESLPVTEDARLDPLNPYAVSKASCDMLGRQYSEAFEMRIVRLRPFNHAGPGQADEYVVSTLARQVAQAEADGLAQVVLRTGDVRAARDFTDVRDVVRAYVLAAGLEPDAYNVCSGRSTSVAELIDLLRGHTQIDVQQQDDPARLRSHEARDMRGSHERLRAASGWEPEIPLTKTVGDTLDWWRNRLREPA